MAEPNFEEEYVKTQGAFRVDFERCEAITGGREKNKFLLYQLKYSMRNADRIDIIVSFLMESGVRMILEDLQSALERGARVRILTGNYLGITQPGALYLIKDTLGEQVDLRFYNEKERSFHPKAYIFHNQEFGEIYIGSSNLSRSALTSGIEWNYHFDITRDKDNFNQFYRSFEDLFYHHSIVIDDEVLKQYSSEWKKPALQKDLDKYDESRQNTKVQVLFQPRGAQIEALYALKNSRREGAEKGLVYAATGVGKTYLAAFDSREYERVLFVAHREEILQQAARSFQNVRHSDDYGFFTGKEKTVGKSVVFASVGTLGRSAYLNNKYFPEDYFDYVVIDEFHHAVTDQYKRIIAYFKPRFLLGLTATPERMDGRSIYELCDYNVPYQISLQDAINKGMLVPFHYYGVYDETVNYSGIRKVKGRYDEGELTKELLATKRYDLIYKHYMKYRSDKALGFCCSRKHAEDRKEALRRLECGEIKVIFSVDMFNEGLDICDIDMVMFLRPTESPVVFLQQLGRGLRKSRGKEFLNVLDFIGNYEKAGSAPFLLSGRPYSSTDAVSMQQADFKFPDDCLVDFDMRLIDLFHEMAKRKVKKEDMVREEYYHSANNWKDLEQDKSTSDFKTWDKKRCISEALKNPVRFLMESGKGIFVKRDGAVLALNEQFRDVVRQAGVAEQMKDVIEFRRVDYYRKRYEMLV